MKNSSIVKEFNFVEILRLYMIFEAGKLYCAACYTFLYDMCLVTLTEGMFLQVSRNFEVMIKSCSHVYIGHCVYPICEEDLRVSCLRYPNKYFGFKII